MKYKLLLIILLINFSCLFSQTISWDLSENGDGVSDNQELSPLSFSFGTGVTSPKFASSGVYAKGWSLDGIDLNDYFQIAVFSDSRDTFEFYSLEYSERRSNSGLRDYEIRYSNFQNFQNYEVLTATHVPDNDKERDTIIEDLSILIMPNDTIFLRWYGYNSESTSGSWRINNGSLKLHLQKYIEDVSEPKLMYATAISSRTVELVFDDKLDTLSIQNNHFRLDNGTHPFYINKEGFKQGKLILEFAENFLLGESITLYYKNISDDAGNFINTEKSIGFVYYLSDAFCVLITEIMSDPIPTVYLPESEYIELYNTKPFPISLKNWTLKINSNKYIFGNFVLDANSYALLVPPGNATLFSDTLLVYELFGNDKLTNSRGKITLLDDSDKWIHQVDYTENWHSEAYKREGGWSLEMIDLSFPCDMLRNWVSSISNTGGSPLKENSVKGDLHDFQDLEVEYAYWKDSSCVVKFNQMLSPDYTPDKSLFLLDNQEADQISYILGSNFIEVFFSNKLNINTVYNLVIKDTITNCSGLYISLPIEIRIGLSSLVEAGDLIINELLFNPKGKHVQYVEIYNVSDKIINLEELKLGVKKDGNLNYKSVLFDFPVMVFPHDYMVLSKNKFDVIDSYNVKYKDKLIQTDQIPTVSTKKGHLLLANKGDLLIDEILYHEEYHSPFLYDNEGVSLEKINPQTSGLKSQSWQSASQSSGFGTPTYRNSQYSDVENPLNTMFELQSQSFSPDMDGYQDYMVLNYQLEKVGYQANVKIYDSKGHFIKELVSNEYTAKQGVWVWDGENDNGQKQAIGIYIILIELIHPDGEIIKQKKSCTLIEKLR